MSLGDPTAVARGVDRRAASAAHSDLPRSFILPRPRLHALVGASLGNGIVLLEAPIGSGKSELLRAMAEERARSGTIVHRIGPRAADGLVTLRNITRALEASTGKDLAPTRHLIVVDAAETWGDELAEWVERLAVGGSAPIDFIIATRPMPQSRRLSFRAPHRLISERDLAFTWDEFRLLTEVAGSSLRQPVATYEAYRDTQGWPFAVAMLTREWRTGRRSGRSSSHPLEAYLNIDDAFVSETERAVYYALSFLPKYNREMLAQVARHLDIDWPNDNVRWNALPCSNEAGWAKLHPLIGAALRREARISWSRDADALKLAAIDWYASAGAVEDAVTLALDLGDRPRVRALAASHGQELLSRGKIEPLVTIGETFGPEELHDPRALAAVTWALMFGGGVAQARAFLREARPEANPALSRTTELMSDCLDVCAGTYRERGGGRFLLGSTGDAYLDAVASDLDILDAIERGMFDEARERHAAFRSISNGSNVLGPLAYGEALVALSHLLDGRPDEARFFAERAMDGAEAAYGFRAPAAAFATSYLIEALFLLGRWNEIDQLVAGRLDVVEQVAFPDGAARAFVTLARVAVAQNRWDSAYEALDRLDVLTKRRGWSVVQPLLWAEQIRIALIQGNDHAAERHQARLTSLAQQSGRTDQISPRFWDAGVLRDLSAIRLLWAAGNRGGAERAAVRLSADPLDWQTRTSLQAFLPQLGGDGEPVHPLIRLERLLFHRHPDLSAFTSSVPSSDGAAALRQACRSLGLTSREEQVLGLLLSGLSYKHIATASGLSVDTIKWHLKRIYQKLDVDGRSGAVVKMASLAGGQR